MRRVCSLFAARLFAVLALLLQIAMPVAMAHAHAARDGYGTYLCGLPDTALSAEAQAAVRELAALLDAPEPTPAADYDNHCPNCAPAHGAPIPEPGLLDEPVVQPQTTNVVARRQESGLTSAPRGLPLGAQAPPLSL